MTNQQYKKRNVGTQRRKQRRNISRYHEVSELAMESPNHSRMLSLLVTAASVLASFDKKLMNLIKIGNSFTNYTIMFRSKQFRTQDENIFLSSTF